MRALENDPMRAQEIPKTERSGLPVMWGRETARRDYRRDRPVTEKRNGISDGSGIGGLPKTKERPISPKDRSAIDIGRTGPY